jgi:hypothetical protein
MVKVRGGTVFVFNVEIHDGSPEEAQIKIPSD